MDVLSEKECYKREVLDNLNNSDVDLIIWGEDLYDASIVPYFGKLSDTITDEKYRSVLKSAALVHFNFKSERPIRSTLVKWDEEQKIVFIPVGIFNGIWVHLKNSIKNGFMINSNRDITRSLIKSVVDFSFISTDDKEAYIKADKIAFKNDDMTEVNLKLMRKKQNALNNQRNRFFYSSESKGKRFHVRDCDAIKEISPKHFRSSVDIPEGRIPCYACRRKAYLRVACDPYVKQIYTIDRILKKHDVNDSKLKQCALDYNLKFHLGEKEDLYVKGAEDNWIIKGFGEKKLSLWHNNYVKTGSQERRITSGFHNQNVEAKSLFSLFEYIHGYSFVDHLKSCEFE